MKITPEKSDKINSQITANGIVGFELENFDLLIHRGVMREGQIKFIPFCEILGWILKPMPQCVIVSG